MAGTAVPVDRPSLDRTVELMQHACAQSNNLILAREEPRTPSPATLCHLPPALFHTKLPLAPAPARPR